jgi:FdhE protein
VAGGFLRKWFGSRTTPSQEVEEARAELERLARDRPALAGPFTLLASLLPDLLPSPSSTPVPALDPELARAKLLGGVPLLRGELPDLGRNAAAFHERWKHVVARLAKGRQDPAAGELAAALRSGRLDAREAVGAIVAGRPESLRERADALGLDPAMVSATFRLALFPYFVSINDAWLAHREGIVWEKGYCPTCGSWPLLGEFRGLEQTRFLRCGLCAAGWEVPRLLCPFCESRDYRQLGFLHVEGEESSYKAATCEVCHGYVKMLSTLTALPPLQLLLADVATLHLDLVAVERGYLGHA